MGRYTPIILLLSVNLLSRAQISTGGGTSCSPGSACAFTPQFSQATAVTVTGVTSATTLLSSTNALGTLTLPANFFSTTGSTLNLRWHGVIVMGATATAATYSITIGAATFTMFQGGTFATGSTSTCDIDLLFTSRTIGSSGTILGSGFGFCTQSTAVTVIIGITPNLAAQTLNTTISNVVNFTVAPGATTQSYTTTNFVAK